MARHAIAWRGSSSAPSDINVRKTGGVMIYRILIDQWFSLPNARNRDGLVIEGRMGGVAGGLFNGLGDTMDELGLPAPCITTRRARFYFTEIGWKRVGQALAADARRRGHVIRVIRRKRPRPSQIVYRDILQLAILPVRRMVSHM